MLHESVDKLTRPSATEGKDKQSILIEIRLPHEGHQNLFTKISPDKENVSRVPDTLWESSLKQGSSY
jgi:hypothetical protein